MHMLFNMFCLFIFGPELEKIAGKTRFLTIYMLSGIFGNIATYFLTGSSVMHMLVQVGRFSGFSAHLELLFIIRSISLPQLTTNYRTNYRDQRHYDIHPAEH